MYLGQGRFVKGAIGSFAWEKSIFPKYWENEYEAYIKLFGSWDFAAIFWGDSGDGRPPSVKGYSHLCETGLVATESGFAGV
jgi:hypothetical protein